jgi:DNA adenine methylase
MGRNREEKDKMIKTYSPLRYPGGKGKLIKYFKELFTENDLQQGTYVELYAGGAAIALSLLIDGYASKIIINDNDRSISAFWYSVLHYTENLCEIIRKTPVNMATWRKQKEIQRKKQEAGILDLGFSTLFLNRTNRSGILSAGVIGGNKQKGTWKINARYNKETLINKIKLIASYRDKIELYSYDSVQVIKEIVPKLSSKTLIYLDPPYYKKGKQLYMNYYIDQDHKEVAAVIRKVHVQKWIITYDEADLIKKVYNGEKIIPYSLRYSAGKNKEGKELMIFSKNLIALNPF